MGFLSDLFKRSISSDKQEFKTPISADVMLTAPVSGTLMPLDEVPDIVISEKVMGDGIAVVPDGNTIVSPCDGVISRLLPSKNAFAVKTEEGVEVYISFGLEAMEVKGEGFTALKEQGDSVKNGEPVLSVDMNFLCGKLKSPVTSMIVIKSSCSIERLTTATGKARAGESPVVWISLAAQR